MGKQNIPSTSTPETRRHLERTREVLLKAWPHRAVTVPRRVFAIPQNRTKKRMWSGHNIRIYQCKPIVLPPHERKRARCGPGIYCRDAQIMARDAVSVHNLKKPILPLTGKKVEKILNILKGQRLGMGPNNSSPIEWTETLSGTYLTGMKEFPKGQCLELELKQSNRIQQSGLKHYLAHIAVEPSTNVL